MTRFHTGGAVHDRCCQWLVGCEERRATHEGNHGRYRQALPQNLCHDMSPVESVENRWQTANGSRSH